MNSFHDQISRIFLGSNLKYILFLALVFLWASANAQDEPLNYRWSPTNKARNAFPFMLVGGDSTKVVSIFKEKRKTVSVRSYNYDTMEESLYSTFDLKENFVNDEELFEAFFLNNKVYFFIDHYNYKEKSQSIDIRTLDLATNKLSQAKSINIITKIKSNKRSSFLVSLNNDSTHFIMLTLDAYTKKSNKSFSAKYIDLEINDIWNKKFSLPYGAAFTQIDHVTTDNVGNLHISLQIAPEKVLSDLALKDRADRKFVLLSYFWQENKIKETDIDLADKWVAELTFDLSDNDEIVMSGFYSNDRHNSVAGSFYLRMNAFDLQVLASGLDPLDQQVVSSLIGKKKADRGKEVPRMHLQHIIVNDEGGATLVGEQYWIRERNEYSINGGYYTRQIFYYMDLVVVKYNNDGSVKWARDVPKRQESVNDNGEFSSIAIANRDNDLFIVFNDNSKNMEIIGTENENLRNFNTLRSNPSLVKIKEDGTIARIDPFKDSKGNFTLRPREFMQCSKDHLIILASRNGNERFCLFDLVE